MAIIMKASDFVDKLVDVAKNYKTLYVMGSFGSPLTASRKKYLIQHNEYNQRASRTNLINAASADTFGFDCVNLIKGILWGWNGDKKKANGGATYKANGVPDTNADGMIKLCKNVSTDFSNIEVGEAVWTNGHIGVYIGDGLAVECTPAWKNKVQITACNCKKSGYNTRTWKKHGKLPWIDYDVKKKPASTTTKTESKPSTSTKVDPAQKKDPKLLGTYKVVAASALHIRSGAGTNKKSLGTLKRGDEVYNYGFYSLASNNAKWLYVKTKDGLTGYCSAKYLKKI